MGPSWRWGRRLGDHCLDDAEVRCNDDEMPGPAMYVMLAMACLLVVVMYSGMAVRPRTNAETPPPPRRPRSAPLVRAPAPGDARFRQRPRPNRRSHACLSSLFPRPPPRSLSTCATKGGAPRAFGGPQRRAPTTMTIPSTARSTTTTTCRPPSLRVRLAAAASPRRSKMKWSSPRSVARREGRGARVHFKAPGCAGLCGHRFMRERRFPSVAACDAKTSRCSRRVCAWRARSNTPSATRSSAVSSGCHRSK